MTAKEWYSWMLYAFKHRRLRKTHHLNNNSLRCFRGHKFKKFVRNKYPFSFSSFNFGIDWIYAYLKYGRLITDINKMPEILIKKG